MSTNTTSFSSLFNQLRTNLWYANRYHLENAIKAEQLHLDLCLDVCIQLNKLDSKRFKREIYPFLPNVITDDLLLNHSV